MKHYLGIDLGGTNIAAGVVEEGNRILAKYSIPTGAHRPFEAVVADMARAARVVVEQAGKKLADFTSVGIGSPSCINPHTGLLVFANNMNWHNVPLAEEFRKHLDLPVYIRNDADCAAFGEAMAGAARGYENVLMLTLGTGVGGGVILNKKIFSGADNMGCELGHTKFCYNGVRCTCGQAGCLEAYASATALINQTREAALASPASCIHTLCGGELSRINGKTAFDAAKQGDAAGKAVVEQYIDYVGAGIAGLVTIFRPEVVIIGGGICHEGDYLLQPLNAAIHKYTFSADEIGVPPAIAAQLGNDAGIIGAAMLELQQN